MVSSGPLCVGFRGSIAFDDWRGVVFLFLFFDVP